MRKLSEAAYKAHKFEINPLNLKRGTHTFHLDHKVSIIQGFLTGVPPKVIGSKDNLQVIRALDNLSKGRK